MTKLLNIALYQLRYLETKILGLSNYKIKNRKYYTANDFELFQNHLNIDKNIPNLFPDVNINDKIDILLINFNNLSLQIKKSLLIILNRVYSITNLILY
ncbi:hypothetical protein [Rickettsia endosymbiont of Gonocerus acuteangulatus]|uniref:hypothetical protein n=1 Tax=Rickettsia endosymbiont of Gonocerus acuteangulatus TaxID=3066266 RepID=UPI00313338DF